MIAIYSRSAKALPKLRKCAATSFPEEVAQEYVDDDGLSLADSPAFKRLCKAIDKGEVATVVSFDVDAISREFEAAFEFMRAIIRNRSSVSIPGARARLFESRIASLRRLLDKGGGAPVGNQNARKLTLQDIAKIHKLRDDGLTMQAIGEKVGVSAMHVSRILKAEKGG